MVMTDEQIVDVFKYRGVGRTRTAAFYERYAAEHWVYHYSFSAYLYEKRIMPQPNQAVAYYVVQRFYEVDLRIPFNLFLFFPLRVGREPPFQDVAHTGFPVVLAIKKLSLGCRVTPPMRVDCM